MMTIYRLLAQLFCRHSYWRKKVDLHRVYVECEVCGKPSSGWDFSPVEPVVIEVEPVRVYRNLMLVRGTRKAA